MTPASAAPTETPSPRPRPLYHLATVAILTLLANCTLTAQSVWEQVAILAAGSPYHNPLEHLDILRLGLFAMAAWSVIRWCDAAQDNLPSLENHYLSDRLHALYWLIPVLQLFLPGMGMAALSRRSNTERDPATGEGQALASILPWAILWPLAIATGLYAPLALHFVGAGSPHAEAWLALAACLLELAALPFLLHIITDISTRQLRRHREVNDPFRPVQPIRIPWALEH